MKIAIVGAGSAGLFSAWYLSQMAPDWEIVVFDKAEPGKGTTWKAAGMLAPVHELEFQELDLLHAGQASRKLYLEEVAPQLGDIGLKTTGTLQIGLSQDDAGYLKRQFEFQQSQGLDVEWLNGEAVQEIEPFISRHISQAIFSKEDTQVDNHLLVERLLKALKKAKVKIKANSEVNDWAVTEKDKVVVIVNGEHVIFDKVLITAGIPSKAIRSKLPYKIYPVRGEMLSLEAISDQAPHTIVRIFSKVLGNAYVVPKEGRILCGSTSEEQGFDMHNTAGGMLDILRKCYAAVPSIYEMKVQEIWAGLRPSTLNRLPILDQEGEKPIFHLNGLYRHGILLGPIMGKSAALLMTGKQRLPETKAFIIPPKI